MVGGASRLSQRVVAAALRSGRQRTRAGQQLRRLRSTPLPVLATPHNLDRAASVRNATRFCPCHAAGIDEGAGEDALEPEPPLLRLSSQQLDAGERRFRRLHAAAVLAGAAADAAGPLLLSSQLPAAVAAAEVLRAALAALAAATPGVEAEAQVGGRNRKTASKEGGKDKVVMGGIRAHDLAAVHCCPWP